MHTSFLLKCSVLSKPHISNSISQELATKKAASPFGQIDLFMYRDHILADQDTKVRDFIITQVSRRTIMSLTTAFQVSTDSFVELEARYLCWKSIPSEVANPRTGVPMKAKDDWSKILLSLSGGQCSFKFSR